MKTILCYGDSNTWGYKVGSWIEEAYYFERYAPNVRWTGRLARLLGKNFRIIEEGLGGRTTDIVDPEAPYKDGATYLLPCLHSHAPIDLVILFLGCNDFKTQFARSISQVSKGMEKLIKIVQTAKTGSDMMSSPEILIIGYPEIVSEESANHDYKGGAEKSKKFHEYYSKLAKKHGCHYLNAAPHVKMSKLDGCHMDEKANKKMAEILSEKILKIYK